MEKFDRFDEFKGYPHKIIQRGIKEGEVVVRWLNDTVNHIKDNTLMKSIYFSFSFNGTESAEFTEKP